MNCPNCNAPDLRTYETFQLPERTIRTKKCHTCLWKFTSIEEIPDVPIVIPISVRKKNRAIKKQQEI
jgi:transcriptional regulator NrdR family protein